MLLAGCTGDQPEGKVFKALSSEVTGIDFSNDLKEDVTTIENVLDFDFFYNGAGVGVGDFDNDGLKDLFFCGNQVSNRLYKNKGELNFEDVSEQSGISNSNSWANGVSVIDINADGLLDIYISVGGPQNQADKRKNLLYINSGNLTFKESAEEYGLADQGLSTQTLFIDVDNDGDMDAYVGNESFLYGYDPLTFYQKAGENENILSENSSHLYRNDNGKFVDITSQAGILKPSFALGLISHDFNNDGYLDIYVANDYFIPDALYENQKDGTFIDRTKDYFNQVSFFGMGLDIGDLNDDGLEDIFVADMASADHIRSKTLMESMNVSAFDFLTKSLNFPYQYMFNSVQLNNGMGSYDNAAHILNLAKTDWSWSVDINDFNLDGSNDVYVTNGYRRYAKDNDFRTEVNALKARYGSAVPNSEKRKLYNKMPSEALSNLMYSEVNGDLENQNYSWGLDIPSFSNGAISADLDNDGDLEIVTNNIDSDVLFFENTTNERRSSLIITTDGVDRNYSFEALLNYKNGDVSRFSSKRVKGYFSSFANEIVAAYSDSISSIDIKWYDGSIEHIESPRGNSPIVISKTNSEKSVLKSQTLPQLTNSTIFEKGAPRHLENSFNDFEKEVLLPYKQSTFGPLTSSSLSDSGETEFFFLGGAAGSAGQIFQTVEGQLQKLNIPVLMKDKDSEDMGSVFFDYDNDGDQDLYVVSGGNEYEPNASLLRDRLYRNDGNGMYKRVRMQSIDASRHSGKTVKAEDFDNDGYIDLIIGNRMVPGMYPLPEPSYILWNKAGVFTKELLTDLVDGYTDNIVNDIAISDLNGDGRKDILLVGEWSAPKLIISRGAKWEMDNTLGGNSGLWFSCAIADVNKDGAQDILLGNIGENSKHKASQDKPLRIYAGDIDGNGTWDMYLSKKWKGKFVPMRGKECSSEQLPFVSEKFPTYEGFANAEINDIISKEVEQDLYQSEVTNLSSLVLLGDDNGHYTSVKLPFRAQLLPILDIEVISGNSESSPKVIIVGNIYDTEVETPRLDYRGGLIMKMSDKAQKDGIFEITTTIPYSADAKSIEIVRLTKKKTDICIGMNNGPVQTFNM